MRSVERAMRCKHAAMMWCDGGATYQMSFSDVSSLTMRLSRGERPVFLPEYAVRAPLEVMAVPVS